MRIHVMVYTGIALALSGCGKTPPPESAPVEALALVNDVPVTPETFRYWWGRKHIDRDTPGNREAVLDELVQRYALVEQARQEGLLEDPGVQAEIHSLLIARLREDQLHKRQQGMDIAEMDVQQFYEDHKATKFLVPERLQVAVLWFDTRGQEPLERRYRARLDEVRRDLLAAPLPVEEGFGARSVRSSEHRASRYQGGIVGWLEATDSHDAWHAAVYEIADALSSPGDISELTIRPEGAFLVRLLKRQPERVRALEDVRDSIVRTLKSRRLADREQAFLQRAKAQVSVRVFPRQLQSLSALPTPDEVARRDHPLSSPNPSNR